MKVNHKCNTGKSTTKSYSCHIYTSLKYIKVFNFELLKVEFLSFKCKCILFLASRKRHKKDRDEAWQYEEHDRRSSGDHRRSGHYHEGRRSSGGGRYRNRSPDDSDTDDYSPPPSLSEGN